MEWSNDIYYLQINEENLDKIIIILGNIILKSNERIIVYKEFYKYAKNTAPLIKELVINKVYSSDSQKYIIYNIINTFLDNIDDMLFEEGMYIKTRDNDIKINNKYECMLVSRALYKKDYKACIPIWNYIDKPEDHLMLKAYKTVWRNIKHKIKRTSNTKSARNIVDI